MTAPTEVRKTLLSAQRRSSQAAVSSPVGVAQTLTQIDGDLVTLDRSHEAYGEAAEELSAMYSELIKKVDLVDSRGQG